MLPKRAKPLAFALVLLLSGIAGAQTDASRLDAALTRAGVAAAALKSDLPSFACKEEVLSQALEGGKKPKVRQQVRFTAEVRVERRGDGELHETFEPVSWAAILSESRGTGIPYYVSGGFQRALDYFDPARAACYRFELDARVGNRIDFSAAPDALRHAECRDESGLVGFALLDATGEVVHVERTVPDAVSRRTNLAPFVAIDLAPVVLNGRTYRLSSRVVSEGRPGRLYGHFEASYSECRLFHATVTIKPGP